MHDASSHRLCLAERASGTIVMIVTIRVVLILITVIKLTPDALLPFNGGQ
jgi:hypothetical protein